MSTLATLLQGLAAARRRGEDFDSAWEVASVEALGSSCDPADWSPVLEATIGTWRACYEGMTQTGSERALSLLSEGMELVDIGRRKETLPSLDEVGRACRRCNQAIPAERFTRSPPIYCSDRCRRQWHSARARVAA